MLEISIVDAGADERLHVLAWLQAHFESEAPGMEFFPRTNLKPVSVSELRFNATPDIIVIGSALAAGPADDILHIRKIVPEVPIILLAPEKGFSVSVVEYFARIGIDEIFSATISTSELVNRFVILASRIKKHSTARLVIVEAAKGGVGATSVSAALGECSAEGGKKTLLVDCDCEGQALSRFLQVRPFFNDALQTIIDGGRPVSGDFVEQCTGQVWADLSTLWCMPPVSDGVLVGALSSHTSRILISLFETLDQMFDTIIVDASRASGTWRRILHRAADQVVFVIESDPAAVCASVEKIKRIREELAPDTTITIVENARSPRRSLPRTAMIEELERFAGITKESWCSRGIPFSSTISHWPGSGCTPFSLASGATKRTFMHVSGELGLSEKVEQPSLFKRLQQIFITGRDFFVARFKAHSRVREPQQLPLSPLTAQELPSSLACVEIPWIPDVSQSVEQYVTAPKPILV